MSLNKTILVALSALTFAVGIFTPGEAFVGRLGSHSVSTVRHWQQSTTRSSRSRLQTTSSSRHHASKRERISAARHGRMKSFRFLSRHSSSPAYMWRAPTFEDSLISDEVRSTIEQDFHSGNSAQHSPATLIEANVFASCPLHGGVFTRKGTVKNIVLHSTETAREADAQRVILSWNHKGLRHAGAQFVVDRNGSIYCTADPSYGTTHVDNRRTRMGVNNDNSVGIEIVRAGTQEYSPNQLQSVVCLVRYLQDRFEVADNHVLGHGQVQPSDRSDPVNFNWEAFTADKQILTRTAFTARE